MANRFSIIILFLIFIVGSSCKHEKRFTIRGIISNANHEKLYLKELTTVDEIHIDSVKINNKGEFKLSGKTSRPAFYSLGISADNYLTLIIHPGEKVFVKADAKDLPHDYAVGGSNDSELAKKLNDKVNKALREINKVHNMYMDSLGTKNILKRRHLLDTMYERIENEHRAFSINFINENISQLASIMALYQELSPRKPLFSIANDYYLFRKADSVLMKLYPDADAVKSLHTLVQNVSEDQAKKMEMDRKLAIGATAPDIEMQGPLGNNLKLSTLKGKYVLVDFWATWKEASLKDLPELVRLYWRYRHNGFDIYQISLDTNKESWLNAITYYGLPWSNVCNFKMYDSPAVALYNVTDVPTRFLIDPNGKILAKKININSLSDKLKDIFKY